MSFTEVRFSFVDLIRLLLICLVWLNCFAAAIFLIYARTNYGWNLGSWREISPVLIDSLLLFDALVVYLGIATLLRTLRVYENPETISRLGMVNLVIFFLLTFAELARLLIWYAVGEGKPTGGRPPDDLGQRGQEKR